MTIKNCSVNSPSFLTKINMACKRILNNSDEETDL